MKIYGGKGPNPAEPYIEKMLNKKRKEEENSAPVVHEPPAPEAEAKDKVQISQRGSEINRAREIVKNAPAVRTEKVREAKKKVDEGTYKVDGKKVAEKIIKENILDELL